MKFKFHCQFVLIDEVKTTLTVIKFINFNFHDDVKTCENCELLAETVKPNPTLIVSAASGAMS